MIEKTKEKEFAIKLRQQGMTYSEILGQIPVAKSTLSLWLREVGLAKRQKQLLTKKRLAAARRGGEAKRQQRIERSHLVISGAKIDVGRITNRELLLIGAALYWAEGAKEKSGRSGIVFQFGNMDSKMILLVLRWLERVCGIKKTMLGFDLYLHESHKHRTGIARRYWSKTLSIPLSDLTRVYYKRHRLKPTNRKNISEAYFGLFRVRVNQSSELVRKIAGWTEGIVQGVEK